MVMMSTYAYGKMKVYHKGRHSLMSKRNDEGGKGMKRNICDKLPR